MKKIKIALLLTTILGLNSAYAQNVRIGNTISGVTASGNTLAIGNGSGMIQLNNMPPLLQGTMSAAREMNSSNQVSTQVSNQPGEQATEAVKEESNINAENAAKLEAAQNNFIKQKEELAKIASETQKQTAQAEAKQVVQEPVRVGQDLSTLKPNIVTNNIGVYNKTTINEIEVKAEKENTEMYSKFPEYMIKNY